MQVFCLLHKPFDAFTIVALMQRSGRPRLAVHLANLVFALVIPVGVLLFFMGVRNSFFVALAIPLSMLLAFVFISAFTIIFIFVIAALLGFELITKVPATLHTPLMSGSNAISGITIVAGMPKRSARLYFSCVNFDLFFQAS